LTADQLRGFGSPGRTPAQERLCEPAAGRVGADRLNPPVFAVAVAVP